MEQPAVAHGTIMVISKKRMQSQESPVIALGFRDNRRLYDLPVHEQIRRAPHQFFEAENYFVTERSIFLSESAEKRVHRTRRPYFAQNRRNIEAHITRDVGI